MVSSDLVIKSHDPSRNRVLWFASALALLITGFFVYKLGQSKGGFDARASSSEIRRLNAQNEHLSEANQRLKQEMATLETGQTIDASSYLKLQETVKSLEKTHASQSKELRFYRQIMSPDEKVEGLHILNPQLSKIEDSEEYQLDMVVYQYHKIIRELGGTLQMTVEGAQNGVPQNYALHNLLSENTGNRPTFNFRYFQSFGLRFVIPEGYVPSNLRIEIIPSTRGYKATTEILAWTDLLQTKEGT